ncbi:hypothetical protein ACJ72_07721 [Emergomyces africanus]|uniref:DNA2/NAM7 helicase-like C-terminal domain-containing protein n=1 Tax=Emergomyces africanus TaxID=1955775 RepID=A0A1B7NMC5_9EURO|nr:hypothetical protein ACJ72_07721 [Emergomyces africanus]
MHNIVYVCDLLIRLHTDADIIIKNLLILTSYQAQYLIYKTALIELQNLFEAQYDKVLLHKVSSFQDEHHSVMIVDLVIIKFIDFLRDYDRLNLALSRARYGRYVIFNMSSIRDRSGYHDIKYLKDMLDHFTNTHTLYSLQTQFASVYITDERAFALVIDPTTDYPPEPGEIDKNSHDLHS